MTETNVIVAIDDIHPEQGWGCEGDIQIEYLDKLWKNMVVNFHYLFRVIIMMNIH